MNRVILIGNVGGDPKTLKDGVCSFSLCTSDFKGDCQWHRVVCFKQTADFVGRYVKKGSLVTVEGRLTYRTYVKNGQNLTYAEVIGERVSFIGQRKKDAQTQNLGQSAPSAPQTAAPQDNPFAYPDGRGGAASAQLTPEMIEMLKKFNVQI